MTFLANRLGIATGVVGTQGNLKVKISAKKVVASCGAVNTPSSLSRLTSSIVDAFWYPEPKQTRRETFKASSSGYVSGTCTFLTVRVFSLISKLIHSVAQS